MKKKSLVLILVLALVTSCMFYGCSGVTRDSVAKEHKNDYKVTFDIGSGAMWAGRAGREMYCYYPKKSGGTYITDPRQKPFRVEATKNNHFFEGWYKDAEFNEKWNFATDKVTEDITLYANWIEKFRYKFRYKDEESGEWKETDYVLYVNEGGTLNSLTQKSRIKRDGYTLFGIYQDENCTIPWKDDYTHKGYMNGKEQIGGTEYAYTTWIKGTFSFMSTADDAVYLSSGASVYLLDDIDLAGKAWTGYGTSYGGIIEGNNHTIKNITLKFPVFGHKNADCGLFGRLLEDAVLRNITFENIVIEVDDDSSMTRVLGLLAGTIENGVKFENVKITGKLIIKRVNPVSYTLGVVAGENDGVGYTGLDYSGIEVVNEFPGYDVTVKDDGSISITAKAV